MLITATQRRTSRQRTIKAFRKVKHTTNKKASNSLILSIKENTMSENNNTPSVDATTANNTPVAAEIFILNVGEVNSAFSNEFGGRLVNALAAVGSGTFVERPVPVITLTYVPSATDRVPRTQSFAVVMGAGYPEDFAVSDLLVADSDQPNSEKLVAALETFKNVDMSCLHFLPLTGARINPAIPLHSQIRGQVGDKTPFIIYSKPVGRVYASVVDGEIKFHSMDGAVLTAYQQKVLAGWFGEGIGKSILPELMGDVFTGTAARFLHQVTNVSNLRKQLDAIENMASEVLCKKEDVVESVE